jgi:hypothetical protein
MRLAALVLLAALGAVFLALGPFSASQASAPTQPHYPDLQTLLPSQLTIQTSSGQKLLRLSNTVVNRGDGRLELRPVNNGGTTKAYQRVYKGDGSLYSESLVGIFAFHRKHHHWHFEDFASYELYTVAADGGIGALVASTEKVTFCIIDVTLVDASLEHASPTPVYSQCNRNALQGLSVGWGDTYPWNLSGQWIDITTGVPNGDYWLVSTADPLNRLNEGGGANETNNSAALKIHIEGNSVSIVP